MTRPACLTIVVIFVALATLAAAPAPKLLGDETAPTSWSTPEISGPVKGKPLEVAEGFELIRVDMKDGEPSAKLRDGFGAGQPVLLHDGRLFTPLTTGGVVRGSFSSDAGRTWTAPKVIEVNPDKNVSAGRPACVLGQDGRIWVFYFGFVKYDKNDPAACKSDVWGVCSDDGGKTWGGRVVVRAGYTGFLSGAIQTSKGRLMVPICYYAEPTRFLSAVAYSDDNGVTWGNTDGIDIGRETDARQRALRNGSALEPTIVELRDGRILMFIRTIVGRIYRCYSADGGSTWTKPKPTDVSCGGTIYITRLKSGRLALVWNPANYDDPQYATDGYPHEFDKMLISLSDDDAETWHKPVAFIKADRVVHSLVTNSGRDGELLLTLPSRPALLVVPEEQLLNSCAGNAPTP